jgi:hypothetical protein
MRATLPKRLESGRIRQGLWATSPDDGFNGIFVIPGPDGRELDIAGGNGNGNYLVLTNGLQDRARAPAPTGWEHVSVQADSGTPSWDEMCFVKELFWDEDECVVQYHPPLSQYVRANPHRLHLWKPKHETIPMPPTVLALLGVDPNQEMILESQ